MLLMRMILSYSWINILFKCKRNSLQKLSSFIRENLFLHGNTTPEISCLSMRQDSKQLKFNHPTIHKEVYIKLAQKNPVHTR